MMFPFKAYDKGQQHMTIEKLRKRKDELHLTYQDIADMSKVPLATVQKVLSGVTTNPRHDTILALEAVLGDDVQILHDPHLLPSGKTQGDYTIDDYADLPDDERYELINGSFYYMEAPSNLHQLIAGKIFMAVSNYIAEHKGDCVPMLAPSDVQLDGAEDNKTLVEPDFFIICDRSRIKKDKSVGAPDFVLEVISPSSRKRDMNIKTAKYEAAGVREYWMVDPDRKKIIVHIFGEEPDVFVYGFNAKVPVSIYDNECIIDFEEISEYVKFLF